MKNLVIGESRTLDTAEMSMMKELQACSSVLLLSVVPHDNCCSIDMQPRFKLVVNWGGGLARCALGQGHPAGVAQTCHSTSLKFSLSPTLVFADGARPPSRPQRGADEQ